LHSASSSMTSTPHQQTPNHALQRTGLRLSLSFGSLGHFTRAMFGKRNKKPFRDVGRSPEAADYLATQLERLMALPLTTHADVEHWYEESSTVEQTLEQRFPRFEPEHEVSHFFSDADIRSRDSGYRDRQDRIMSEYVQFLRNEPNVA